MLLRGISISSFETNGIKISQLYIKLDKKLILKTKSIELTNAKNNSEFNLSSLAGLSTKIYFLNLLFKQIELDSVKIGDKNVHLNYDGSRLYVDTDVLNAKLSLKKQENEKIDFIKVENLTLKDFNLSLSGIASIEALKEKFAFSGEFKSYEINGKIDATLHFNELKYKIYNANATSIKDFMDAIELKTGLSHDIREWIQGNILAQNYILKSLEGRVNLKTKNFYLNELKAQAILEGLSVKFEKTLPSATAKSTAITLKNSRLDFSLNSPKYNGNDLNGTSVFIHDIFGDDAGLVLDIRINALFNKDIKTLLKAYDINVPITQYLGKTDTNLTLNISFDPFDISSFGRFQTQNSALNIAGVNLNVKKADIVLNKNSTLLIDADTVDMGFLKTNLKATLDLKQDKATLQAKNLNLNIADLVILKEENADAFINFSGDSAYIEVPKYGFEMNAGKNLQIKLNSNLVLDHFSLTKSLGLSDFKSIEILSDDFDAYNISVNEASFNLPLLLNGAPYNLASFNIQVKKDSLSAKSDDEKLSLEYKNDTATVWLNGLDVDTNALLKSKDENTGKVILKIIGKNSALITKSGLLELKSYNLSKNGANVTLSASPKYSGMVKFNQNTNSWHLVASDVAARSINSLISKDSFEDGSFNLVVSGSNEEHFKGELDIKDTYLKDYVFYQKLLSFIDTIPSLLSLKTPDFNKKGFKVNNGKVRFKRNKDKLEFEGIYLSGTSSDLLGSGSLDIKTQAIDFTLELRFLKAVSNTIGQIPLVGYIFLGKDRSLSTVIKINGTMSEPTYQTQVLTDTLLSPFKLIRNIISAPFNF